jgi:hypothetical protein
MNYNSKKRDQLQKARNTVKANSESNVKTTQNEYLTKFEKFGYKLANRLHRIGVLSLVGFICFNIYLFGKEYNAYWRARRVYFYLTYRILRCC